MLHVMCILYHDLSYMMFRSTMLNSFILWSFKIPLFRVLVYTDLDMYSWDFPHQKMTVRDLVLMFLAFSPWAVLAGLIWGKNCKFKHPAAHLSVVTKYIGNTWHKAVFLYISKCVSWHEPTWAIVYQHLLSWVNVN